MIRLLFAFILVFGVGALTFFLWQKQVSQYNFFSLREIWQSQTFEQKEGISKNFQDAIEDFEENLAPFDEVLKKLEEIDWRELATSTLETATKTEETTTSTVAE